MIYTLTEEQIRFIAGRIAAESTKKAAADYGVLLADAFTGSDTTFEQMERIWDQMPDCQEDISAALAAR